MYCTQNVKEGIRKILLYVIRILKSKISKKNVDVKVGRGETTVFHDMDESNFTPCTMQMFKNKIRNRFR